MPISGSPKIFYVGNFRFPDRDAGSHRVHGMGKALRGAGYEVVFLGAETIGRPQDAAAGDGYRFDNFSYYPAGNAGNSPMRRALRLWRTHLSGLSAMSRLKALWTDDSVAFFAYQASSLLLAQLSQFCNRHRAVLVADVVEWYDRRHITWGRFGPFALDSELCMRYMHGQADGVVAISSYLESYYGRRGKPTLRVPPLVDIRADCWRRPSIGDGVRSALQLAFVGTAGEKDLLVNAIRGLALIGNDARNWELVMVGPDRAELARNLGVDANLLQRLNGTLRFVGFVSHAEGLAHLGQASFSMLLRPDLRFARAGFPTKLVESLAMGVPVICNLTSDIGLYVRDGQEGLVVKDCSPGAFAEGLRRASALSQDQRAVMRANARQRALVSFDYRNWVEPIGAFLRQVIETRHRGRQ